MPASHPTDPSPPLRWGILGTAAIARNKVVPGMRRSLCASVTAIASRSQARAVEVAAQLGVPTAHGSYEALLADPDVDAVYIPLPNHLHVPWTIRAAEAGKHVLCEKPIALSVKEGRELITARERNDVIICEAFMVRAHPQWECAARLVREGRVGDLRLITGHFSYNRGNPQDIRNHAEWGGGGLLDIGCYPVMIARWLFQAEPARVAAMLDIDPELGVDRIASAILGFAHGQAQFTTGTQMHPAQWMTVFGTGGRIDVPVPFNAPPDGATRIDVTTTDGSVESIVFPPVDQYALQADRFAQAVRGERPVLMTLEDSMGNAEVLERIRAVAQRSR